MGAQFSTVIESNTSAIEPALPDSMRYNWIAHRTKGEVTRNFLDLSFNDIRASLF